MKIVVDIETDGLMDTATKIHCLCYQNLETGVSGSLTDYEEIRNWLSQPDLILIGHNIIRYDIPILKKLLGIEIKAELIDTLPLSWALYPQYKKHGLEIWGEIFGVHKPEISDWKDLPIEEYVHRCNEDVKINTKLWNRELFLLNNLYNKDQAAIVRYIQYLSFKMDCVKEQEEVGIRIDVPHCESMVATLSKEKEAKITQLALIMPKCAVKKKAVYKNALLDENGNVFQQGDLFFSSIDSQTRVSDIEREKIIGWKDPNPNSPSQIKDWLFSLGWEPETFKFVKNKKDQTDKVLKKIPQIASKNGYGELCDSVKRLFIKEPRLEVLDSLGVISHRISVFKGFLTNKVGDRLYPTCSNLANTLRLKHSIIANLPGLDKKWGHEVRASLIADEGKLLCGSDLSNIEDRTKRHYIYPYDPAYVEEMNTPGYDAHLDIAKLAGFITTEDVELYKQLDEKKDSRTKDESIIFSKLKKLRAKAKVVNFSATYKVGADTMSRNSGMTVKESKNLLLIYWERNHSILKVEKSLKVKEAYGHTWLFNPVSKFWYTLRAEKDRFSTLNQGTAVYVFDTWLKHLRPQGIKVSYQCHDEWLGNIESKGVTTKKINKAIAMVNEELKLNIQVGCSVDYGENYSETH